MPQNGTPRILITRLSHIGDVVLTLPMMCRIREAIPQAAIAWAVEPAAAKLLRLHPDIDDVIEIPRGWAKNPKNWWRLRAKLRAFQPDITIDPQSLLKSSLLARLSGARRRIGFRGKHGREGSTFLNNELVSPESPHLVDRSLELLQALNIPMRKVQFRLPVCKLAMAKVDGWLGKLGLNRFVLMNPGAGWPSKQWLPERFGETAKTLFQHRGLRSLVVWSGSKERIMAETVSHCSGGFCAMAPATSLTELAAVATRAELFLGGDTGPLHIATAMGCQCVGLYGPTNPEESGAYGPKHVAIQKWYQAGTNSQRRAAENLALREITVDEVVQAIELCLTSTRSQVSSRAA